MTINPDLKISTRELQHEILLRGIWTRANTVIPYPSSEYVRSNLLDPRVKPFHSKISQIMEKNPALKGDKTWELIGHWYVEGLQIKGYQEDRPNPLEDAYLYVGDLLSFFEDKPYGIPAFVYSFMPQTTEHKNSQPGNLEKIGEPETSTAASNQPDTGTEDTELRRTQRTLAALAIGLADKHPAYRHGEKTNVKALAETATDHLRDANGRTPHGFSDRTARDAITAALKACRDLLNESDKTG